MPTAQRTDWATPSQLMTALEQEFGPLHDITTPEADAFVTPWYGKVYANPPYGSGLRRWLERAHSELLLGHAELIVMLLPARTDVGWFHDLVLGCAEIRFLRGRLHFDEHPHPAPFPSMLIIFRKEAAAP